MKKIMLLVALLFASPAVAEDIIDSVFLKYEPSRDNVTHSTVKNERLSATKMESYWTLYGNIEGTQVFMRRIKFRIDCKPENWPNKIMISPITVALGDKQLRMLKIIWVPPGAEEWYDWNHTNFINEHQIMEACYWLETKNGQ